LGVSGRTLIAYSDTTVLTGVPEPPFLFRQRAYGNVRIRPITLAARTSRVIDRVPGSQTPPLKQ
jgi:hypothetical protein